MWPRVRENRAAKTRKRSSEAIKAAAWAALPQQQVAAAPESTQHTGMLRGLQQAAAAEPE